MLYKIDMKRSAAWFLAFALVARSLWATEENEASLEKVPLDIFEMENAYIFESDLNHGGVSIKQDSLQNDFYYAHRFLLKENWYIRGGVAYDRFDFGETAAPIPTQLQSLAAVVSLDYMHGKDIGAMLEFRPGFYTENDFRGEAFDCPITLMRFWVLQPERFYVLTGVNYSFLRGAWAGVVPVVGFVWVPDEQKKWQVMAVPPEPRIVYSWSKQLDLYVGGQVEGGSFRTDEHNSYRNNSFLSQFNNAQVDYYDFRAGVGFVWSPTDNFDLDLGGGYSVQRQFDFHRASEVFRSDPAPYVRFELKAKF